MCRQCQGKGYDDCQRTITLKWETEYVGKAFGRAGVYKKDATKSESLSPYTKIAEELPWQGVPHISPYSFVNVTARNIEELTSRSTDLGNEVFPVSGHQRDDTSSTASLSPWLAGRQLWRPALSIPATLAQVPHLKNPIHSDLLAYYVEHLCPLTVPSSVAKSPFASLLLPFSVTSSPAVLDSLLALSACHRSRTDQNFKPTALQLSDKVLRRLRFRLNTEDPHAVALDPETLVIMMVLCQYEIMNECDKRWVVHLKGARDLIRVRRQALTLNQHTSSATDIVAFAEKFFAYQDVIGRTACGEQPNFGSDFWAAQRDEADSWLGCSPALVGVIHSITELSWERRANPDAGMDPAFQLRANLLTTRLASLEQRVYDEDDYLLQTSAELKRIAAELYLHCAIDGASPAVPIVRNHIQQMLRLVSVLLEHSVTAGLSWPVFVAAVELDPMEDLKWASDPHCHTSTPAYARPFILFALNKMSVSTANITRTRAVIEKVWQTREFGEFSGLQRPMGSSSQNDWEQYVAPFCGNMSLV